MIESYDLILKISANFWEKYDMKNLLVVKVNMRLHDIHQARIDTAWNPNQYFNEKIWKSAVNLKYRKC